MDQTPETTNEAHKAAHAMLPYYRGLVIFLLGIITFIVGHIYTMVLEDHDANTAQKTQMEQFKNLPERVEQNSRDIVQIKTKIGINVAKN